MCTFRYDAEAIYFDEGVRSAKREQLESKLLQVMPSNSIYVESLGFLFHICFIGR